ncbi:MAG: N-acetylmuramoyl-L-alanine amidase, partial [Rhizobiales bacterium]|nr:N-acetylmuramoyl-L-alanine amidase [Hyphomicrobiales bacterium]
MNMPDSPCASRFAASPNHEPRSAAVDMIVLHYTGMATAKGALERLCDPEAKVSAHYLVGEDGAITQMVAEDRRAYHAGVSSWQGTTDINSRSIGIEIVNGGHDFGCPDFPPQQIDAVIRLCQDVQSRFAIPQANVLAHSDIAPSRKQDPGEKFPWKVLHEAGVGLWVAPAAIADGNALRIGDESEAVGKLQTMLRAYGYGVEVTNTFGEMTRDVVTAFQRHFRPARVDGAA